MESMISENAGFLKESVPYEIERKFLIEYPDVKLLEEHPDCQKSEIIQTYLKFDNNEEVRVRQRGLDGNYIYYKTTKKKITNIRRIEIEERISQEEYSELLSKADTSMHQIQKTRYCLAYEGQCFEIDIYPFWTDKAIAEIELESETREIKMPKIIKVIKEVTDDEAYRNSSLARNQFKSML